MRIFGLVSVLVMAFCYCAPSSSSEDSNPHGLVIHNIHLLNNTGVNIFTGTTDFLELWGLQGSEVEGSRLFVRLDAQASQLVISHTGSAFVGVFREPEDEDKYDVDSLYPPQGVLLAKEDSLPMGETVTDVTVPVAEHDILFLVIPHTLSWSMKPVDLMGVIPGACAASPDIFRSWATKMAMLFPKKDASVLMATVGRRQPEVPQLQEVLQPQEASPAPAPHAPSQLSAHRSRFAPAQRMTDIISHFREPTPRDMFRTLSLYNALASQSGGMGSRIYLDDAEEN